MNEYNYYCGNCGKIGYIATLELLGEIGCEKCGNMVKVGVN